MQPSVRSDVHGLASGRGPGQPSPIRPAGPQSYGLTTALARPEVLESQSHRLRPRLLYEFFGNTEDTLETENNFRITFRTHCNHPKKETDRNLNEFR